MNKPYLTLIKIITLDNILICLLLFVIIFRSHALRQPGTYRKIRRRAVFKNGECNIFQKKIADRKIRFLHDVFTTMVDAQWRYNLIVFALGFLLSWLGFAMIWWLIVFTHGDLEEMHLPQNQGNIFFSQYP